MSGRLGLRTRDKMRCPQTMKPVSARIRLTLTRAPNLHNFRIQPIATAFTWISPKGYRNFTIGVRTGHIIRVLDL